MRNTIKITNARFFSHSTEALSTNKSYRSAVLAYIKESTLKDVMLNTAIQNSRKDVRILTRALDPFLKKTCKSGEWRKSLDIVNIMFEFETPPSSYTCNCVITACTSNGALKEGAALLQKMVRYNMADSFSYKSMLSGYNKAGEWQDALLLWKHMKLQGVQVDESNYNSLIMTCGRAGRCDEALWLLTTMADTGFSPSVFSYGGLAEACARSGAYVTGLRLLDLLANSKMEPTPHIYQSVYRACVNAGRTEEASRIEKLHGHKWVPTGKGTLLKSQKDC